MRSTTTRARMAGLTLAVACAAALTGCGDSDNDVTAITSAATSATSAVESSSAAETSAPETSSETSESSSATSETSETSSETSSTSESSSTSAANNADKPPKDDVKKGLTKIFEDTIKKDPDSTSSKLIDPAKLANCITDEGYDDLSPEFLKVLASGKDQSTMPGTAQDRTTYQNLARQCGPKSLKAGASVPSGTS
ncbi:hypothetical protein ACMYYO_11825 [Dermacoccaceae bacterium W4C1]